MKSSRKKKKIRRIRKKLRSLLPVFCAVFLLLVCFSGWKVYSIIHGYRTAERRYDNLAGSVVAASAPSGGGTPAAAPAETPAVQNGTAEAPAQSG